jgi:hypothetical protein
MDAGINQEYAGNKTSLPYTHLGVPAEVEKSGTRVMRVWPLGLPFFNRNVQVIKEVPSVLVKGTVEYEKVNGNNPQPVLEALGSIGFEATVVPTPEHVEDIVARLEAEDTPHSSMSRTGDYQGSGMIERVTGIRTGLGL